MFTKKILGIYCTRDSFEYIYLNKGLLGRIALKSPCPGYAPFDRQTGGGTHLLKKFLTVLPVDPSRKIFLTLPRSHIFIREMTLPAMAYEDAVVSIENSLAIHCHLPSDEIYYDIYGVSERTDQFKALLFYAAKKELDPYLDIFNETGHGRSITAIFPVSYGISTLIASGRSSSASDEIGLYLDQGAETEVVVVKEGDTHFSITVPKDAEDELAIIQTSLKARFPEMGDELRDAEALYQELAISNPSINKLPPLELNKAAASVTPYLLGARQISINDQPVKIKIFQPFTYILPFLCLLMIGLYYMTTMQEDALRETESTLTRLQGQVVALESKLSPLEGKIEALAGASKFNRDVERFMLNRPALFTVVNEIATLIPEKTWFSSLTFNNGQMTLRGRGEDALKVIELLRSSILFEDVALKGSVNRRKSGDEHFSVSLKIAKPPESETVNTDAGGDGQ